MGFRDDNEALRARIRSLESDNERLEDEKEAVEEQLRAELARPQPNAAPTPTPKPEPKPEPTPKPESQRGPPNSDRLQAFMRGEGDDDIRSLFGNGEPSEKTATTKIRPRVTCTKVEDGEVVHVRKRGWRESLKSGWAAVPAIGLGAALGGLESDIPLPWTVGLAIMTCALALAVVLSPQRWRLELRSNRFKLFRNGGSKPVVEGSMDELCVRIRSVGDGPHHAEIGLLGEDGHSINKLSRSDAYRLRDALERAGKKRTM
ncbi:MAG: septum formation initiator family protein [Polyangiales bacterium]